MVAVVVMVHGWMEIASFKYRHESTVHESEALGKRFNGWLVVPFLGQPLFFGKVRDVVNFKELCCRSV